MVQIDNESRFASAQQTQSAAYRNMIDNRSSTSAGNHSYRYGSKPVQRDTYSNTTFSIDEEDEDMYNESLGQSREHKGLNDAGRNVAAEMDELGSNPMSHDSTFKRKRKRNMCIVGLLMLLVGGLVIGLAVVYTNRKDGNTNNTTAGINSAEEERGGVDNGGSLTLAPTASSSNGITSRTDRPSVATTPAVSPAPTRSHSFWDNIVNSKGDAFDGDETASPGGTEPTVPATDYLSLAPSPKPVESGAESSATPTVLDASSGIGMPSTPADADETVGEGGEGEEGGGDDEVDENNIFDETGIPSPVPTVTPGNPTASPVSPSPMATQPTTDEDRGVGDSSGGEDEEEIGALTTTAPTQTGDGSSNGSESSETPAPTVKGNGALPTKSSPSAQPSTARPSKSPTDTSMPTVTPGNPTRSPISTAPTTEKSSLAPTKSTTGDSGGLANEASPTAPPAPDGDGATITTPPPAATPPSSKGDITTPTGPSDGGGNGGSAELSATESPSKRPNTNTPTVTPGNPTRIPVTGVPVSASPTPLRSTPAPGSASTPTAASDEVGTDSFTFDSEVLEVANDDNGNGVVTPSVAVAQPTGTPAVASPTAPDPVSQPTPAVASPTAPDPVARPTPAVATADVSNKVTPTVAVAQPTPVASPTALPTWRASISYWSFSNSFFPSLSYLSLSIAPEKKRRATEVLNKRRNDKRRKALSPERVHQKNAVRGKADHKDSLDAVSTGSATVSVGERITSDAMIGATGRRGLKRIRKALARSSVDVGS